ncbi:MAG TPA: response regulator [Spirochaetia bacterium]|nr:response regulator [Spirochaetia bacterium]
MTVGNGATPTGNCPDTNLVLIVDDEEPNLRLLSRVLTRAGFRAAVATSGEQALSMLEGYRPDLILMDIRLGGMDGLEAIRRIKANPALAGIPVIAVSAYAMQEDFARAEEAGASGYVTKPFRMREIVEAVKMHISARKGRP